MLARVIQKEILANLVRPSFFVTSALCAILVLLGVYTGIQNYVTQKAEYDSAVLQNRKNLENQPSFGALAGLGTKINKPPAVLGIVSSGEESVLGRVAKVDIAFEPKLVDSKFESNPIQAVFGELDLTFVTKAVLSLLALLWSYNVISGEKEAGTLRLVLSGAVPRHVIVLGKAIGGFLCLFAVLAVFFLLSLVAIVLHPDLALDSEAWIKLALTYGVYILYVAVFLTLGLLVSTRTTDSSISLLILLAIWTTLVLVVPKVSVIVAGQIVRVPSAQELQGHKDAVLMEIQGEAQQKVMDYQKEIGQAVEAAGSEEAKAAKAKEARDQFMEKVKALQADLLKRQGQENARLDDEYRRLQQQHTQLALLLSRISPASAMTYAVTTLAGTGVERHERFRTAVRAYKEQFVTYVNERMFENPGQIPSGKLDLSAMPVFEHREEPLSDSVQKIAPDVLVLCLYILIAFLAAYVSFLKYDVR